MNTLQQIEEDIKEFLDKETKIFFNERDFQVELAFYLKGTNHYKNIHLEYSLPLGTTISSKEKKKNKRRWVWNEQLKQRWEEKGGDYTFLKKGKKTPQSMETYEKTIRIDIVVEGYDNYFYPIELKYKTKEQNGSFERFQENLDNLEILKDHGARNLGRYSFWKDVARLQFVKGCFNKVRGGICVFITNDDKYTKHPTDSSERFSMEMKTEPLESPLKWPENFKLQHTTHPEFSLQGNYRAIDVSDESNTKWKTLQRTIFKNENKNEKEAKSVDFYYCIVEV